MSGADPGAAADTRLPYRTGRQIYRPRVSDEASGTARSHAGAGGPPRIYAGIFVAPFLVVAALTGFIYVFAPQIDRIAYHDQLYVSKVDIGSCPSSSGSTGRGTRARTSAARSRAGVHVGRRPSEPGTGGARAEPGGPVQLTIPHTPAPLIEAQMRGYGGAWPCIYLSHRPHDARRCWKRSRSS
jgi:hypothetical protein